jgi:ribonuclease D
MRDRLIERARATGRVALDTEFMSERRYPAMLCLVQLAVRDADAEGGILTEVLDPLDGGEPGALPDLLADPSVEVVVHAGRQDVAILKRTWDTAVANLFDTQVAAAFLGYGAQEGSKSLVGRVLKLPIDSAESFTRWDRRPLTAEQLRYAREDARHLLELAEALEAELERAGRLEWAREESRGLEAVSDLRDGDSAFARLPRAGRLKGRTRAIAYELALWRDEVARSADRSPASVLPDHVLVELARQAPTRLERLGEVRGLPPATQHRRGRDLLAAIERGGRREPPGAEPSAPPPAAEDSTVAGLLGAVLRQRSAQASIGPQLVANQDELVRLAAAVRRGQDASSLRLMSGWRRELVGDELLELARGRRAVRVGAAGSLEVVAAGDGQGTAAG